PLRPPRIRVGNTLEALCGRGEAGEGAPSHRTGRSRLRRPPGGAPPRWPSRLVATAAENRLSIRRMFGEEVSLAIRVCAPRDMVAGDAFDFAAHQSFD